MNCPDHARALVNGACPMCRGVLFDAATLEVKAPGSIAHLAVETREQRLKAARVRVCPSCSVPMAPMRIGQLEGWVERCPSCESLWCEPNDLAALDRMSRMARRQQAYGAMSEAERKELAQGLAESEHRSTGPDMGIAEVVLAVAGAPVVDKLASRHRPVVVWIWAVLLIGFYGFPQNRDALAYPAGSGEWLRLLTAPLMHFSLAHLIGNLAFLMVFGRAAETRMSRYMFVAVVVGLGPFTIGCDALVSDPGVLIGGASGAIAGMIGLTLVLQRKARVTLFFFAAGGLQDFQIPLWVYAVGWGLLQLVLFAAGVEGVAFVAHVAGLIAGAGLGLSVKRFDPV